MNENYFLNNEPDIKAWLKRLDINQYQINSDMSVNVKGDVNLRACDLEKIEVQFAEVTGSFFCDNNRLIDLKGAPRVVGGDFSCTRNLITSLEGCPEKVGGSFDCSVNQLKSLRHAPQSIKESFNCAMNKITSLEFCPDDVGEYFYCMINQIASLEFCPTTVAGNVFFCEQNLLPEEIQAIRNFKNIYQYHQEFLKIKEERHHLDLTLPASPHPKPPYKI